MKRFLWLGFVLLVYLICSGCGDTFRPIIIPNPPTFPNPAGAHTVVSINYNEIYTEFDDVGTFVPMTGSAMVIDVSGDSDVSIQNVGFAPVHAVQQSAGVILVVNQAQTLSNNVPTSSCSVAIPPTPPNQTFNVCPSITKLNFSSTTISSTNTISLPIYSGASFVAVAPSATTAYVTLPTYPPDPTQPQTVVPSVGVVNTLSNSLVATIPLSNNPSTNPYALAVTPDNTKLYVANNSSPCNPPTSGVCSISALNTADQSSRGIVGPTGSPAVLTSPPIWLTARSDSQAVYVLEATTGTLAWLNTTSTAGPDTLTETSNPMISVPGATTMTYDPNLNRLYIPGGQQVAIVDVSQSPPQYLAGGPITIPTVAPTARGAADPCSLTSAQTLTVAAATALPDGTRAYVGAYYVDTNDNICPQVTVIDAVSYAVKSAIVVPGFPDATNPNTLAYYVPVCATMPFRFMMAAAGDSSRAYLSSCDGGMVNIIDTSNDTYILNQPAPVGSRAPIPPSALNPPQNPVFLIAGP